MAAAWFWCAAFRKDYQNLPWYWYCFRGRIRLGGKGRFLCAAFKGDAILLP